MLIAAANESVTAGDRSGVSAGPFLSAAAHLLAGVLIALAPIRPLPPPPPPRAIEVEIVSPGELAAAAPSIPTPAAPAPPAPLEPAPARLPPAEAQPGSDGFVVARRFYTADLLERPEMERTRAALAQYADTDRIAQLCNIEGMEQIRLVAPQYDPDVIVPYAMADMRLDGMTLVAAGAAFRSRRQWYELAFTCTATADYRGVESFAFRLGGLIPANEWDAHNLNASDDDEDQD